MDSRRRLDAVLQAVAVKTGSAFRIFLRETSGQFAQDQHERDLSYKGKMEFAK
jgi:hypothetical protein